MGAVEVAWRTLVIINSDNFYLIDQQCVSALQKH